MQSSHIMVDLIFIELLEYFEYWLSSSLVAIHNFSLFAIGKLLNSEFYAVKPPKYIF